MVPRTQAIVELITGERARFERFCRSLSEAELGRPVPGSSWVVKDFISHVATLDLPYRGWLLTLAGSPDGGLHRGSPDFDVDAYNEAAVAASRDRGVEEILQEAARARTAVVTALARLDDARLDATVRFGGDRKRPPVDLHLDRFLQGWARHDAIHVADMLKALPERRTDPEIAAWLEAPEVTAVVGSYQKAKA